MRLEIIQHGMKLGWGSCTEGWGRQYPYSHIPLSMVNVNDECHLGILGLLSVYDGVSYLFMAEEGPLPRAHSNLLITSTFAIHS